MGACDKGSEAIWDEIKKGEIIGCIPDIRKSLMTSLEADFDGSIF